MADIRDFGFEPRRIEVFDSSMLKDYMDCPAMFYLRHILGLIPARKDVEYDSKFDWGTCWHHVMWAYYREGGDIVKALAALEEYYPSYIRADTDRHGRSKERMVKALFGYFDKWQSKLDEMEILRHEQFFDVYFEEWGFRWCGRIDSIRRWKKNKRIFVWDYKTSSLMGDLYFDQHELGIQFPGYVAATRTMTGEEIMEIRIDVLYMLKNTMEFFQKTFRYDMPRLNEWARNVKMWIDLINAKQDQGLNDPTIWMQNRNECTRYGRCPFFDVHSISPAGSARINILQQEYKMRRWDPSNMED